MKKRFPFSPFKLSILLTLILFIALFAAMPEYTPKLLDVSVRKGSITQLENIPAIERIEIPKVNEPNLPKRIVESDDGDTDDIDDFTTDFDTDMDIFADDDRTIYEIYETPPALLTDLAPVYPEAAIQLGIEGTVWLKLVVEKDGTVSSVEITKGVNPLLDRAALEAAYGLVFSPAMSRDIPVRAFVNIPVRFRLQ